MDIAFVFIAVVGSLVVLFIPGFSWTYLLFRKTEMDVIERAAISFGLSIVLVPTSIFYANRIFGISVNLFNCIAIIAALTAFPIAANHLWRGHNEQKDR